MFSLQEALESTTVTLKDIEVDYLERRATAKVKIEYGEEEEWTRYYRIPTQDGRADWEDFKKLIRESVTKDLKIRVVVDELNKHLGDPFKV